MGLAREGEDEMTDAEIWRRRAESAEAEIDATRKSKNEWCDLADRAVRQAHARIIVAEARAAELEAELNRLRHVCLAFAETAEQAVCAAEEVTKGGQHVPYYGDFANVPPSTLFQLRWWARWFRSVMGGEK